MSFDKRLIEEILNSVNIVDLIMNYIPLQKSSGTNFIARCPFHNEKTASFTIFGNTQTFKCFGCGKQGNSISFLMEIEKLTFIEALKKLADISGIVLEDSSPQKIVNSKKELIYTVYELAADFYKKNFKKYFSEVEDFFKKRQIPLSIAESFSLGYSLNSFNSLKSYLIKNNINNGILSQTGLFLKSNERDDYFDLFRERLMFPIFNSGGRVVAFGARTLSEDKEIKGKYINSPTTEIYVKGRELYGLHVTRFEISKQDSVLICEGYLDFLRLYEKGFKNSVASLGTALTIEQVKTLSRYTKNFLLIYDGDNAGINAAIKGGLQIIKQGCSPKIILLPANEDPDSFLLTHSLEEFQKLIDNSIELVPFVNKIYSNKREAIQLLVSIEKEITDDITRDLFLNDIRETFKVNLENIHSTQNNDDNIVMRHISHQQDSEIGREIKEEIDKPFFLIYTKEPLLIVNSLDLIDANCFLNDNYRQIFNFLRTQPDITLLPESSLLFNKFSSEYFDNDALIKIFHNICFHEKGISFDTLIVIESMILRFINNKLDYLNNEYKKDPSNIDLLEEKLKIKEIEKKLTIKKKVVRKILK
jgi:DNA primase